MSWIVSNSLDILVFSSNLSFIQGVDSNLSRGYMVFLQLVISMVCISKNGIAHCPQRVPCLEVYTVLFTKFY